MTSISSFSSSSPSYVAEGKIRSTDVVMLMDPAQIAKQAEQISSASGAEGLSAGRFPQLRAPVADYIGTTAVAGLVAQLGCVAQSVVSLSSNALDGDRVLSDIDVFAEQSAERHFGASESEAYPLLIVADRYASILIALSEADRKASVVAGKESVMLVERATKNGELAAKAGVAAAHSDLGAAIAGAGVSAGIGAMGTRQIVASQRKLASSTANNVMPAIRSDSRVKSAALNERSAAGVASRPATEIRTRDGKIISVPSDADGATDAMKAVSRSDVRESEAGMARASHDVVQARAQMDHVRGMFMQSYATSAGNVVERGIQVNSAKERGDQEVLNQSNRTLAEMASKQQETANRLLQKRDSILQVLSALNAQNAATSNAILANTGKV